MSRRQGYRRSANPLGWILQLAFLCLVVGTLVCLYVLVPLGWLAWSCVAVGYLLLAVLSVYQAWRDGRLNF